jgi:hypothetical protein
MRGGVAAVCLSDFGGGGYGRAEDRPAATSWHASLAIASRHPDCHHITKKTNICGSYSGTTNLFFFVTYGFVKFLYDYLQCGQFTRCRFSPQTAAIARCRKLNLLDLATGSYSGYVILLSKTQEEYGLLEEDILHADSRPQNQDQLYLSYA